MASRGRVQINIRLNGQDDAFVHSYTTLDRLEGQVDIIAPQKTEFDAVQIHFEGHAKAWVERLAPTVASSTRAEAHHSFLKLQQPTDAADYPSPRVLEAGRTYTFPFTFVIPPRMVPACRHKCASDQVRDAHTELPPSFGDPNLAGDGEGLLDDMAPDMAKIWYGVNASLTRRRQSDGKELKIVEKMKKVRVIPAYDEHAPVNAEFKSKDYFLRAEKTLSKGMLKGKLGRLVMEATQPRDLRLPPLTNASEGKDVHTRAVVQLRFDPADESSQPPKLSQLATKMKVNTWYSSVGMKDFPVKENTLADGDRGLYSINTPLNSRSVQAVQWRKHDGAESTEAVRRGSHTSTDSIGVGAAVTGGTPEPSARYRGSSFYTAEIKVPINLPKCKFFAPTFFSCLVARIYQLEIALSINTPGLGVSPSLQVRVPIQVSTSRRWNTDSPPLDSPGNVCLEDDDPLVPRHISPPPEAYTETFGSLPASPRRSMALPSPSSPMETSPPNSAGFFAEPAPSTAPPGYSFFAGASHGVPVRIPSPVGISPGCG